MKRLPGMETVLVKTLPTMVWAAWASARVPTAKYIPRSLSVGRPIRAASTTEEKLPTRMAARDRHAGLPEEVGNHGTHAEEGHNPKVHLARIPTDDDSSSGQG